MGKVEMKGVPVGLEPSTTNQPNINTASSKGVSRLGKLEGSHEEKQNHGRTRTQSEWFPTGLKTFFRDIIECA